MRSCMRGVIRAGGRDAHNKCVSNGPSIGVTPFASAKAAPPILCRRTAALYDFIKVLRGVMPPKIKDLISQLEQAGFGAEAAREAIGIMCIRMCPDRSPFQALQVTMLSFTKCGLLQRLLRRP